MLARGLALFVILAAAPAYADGQPVEVEVGKSIELEVGFARGLICDDLTVVHAELRGKTEQTNVLVLTGASLGETLCRVGTVPAQIHFLFDVHVVPAKPKR